MTKSKFKRVAIGAITATVIASTFATSMPFNVLTAKAAEGDAQKTSLNSSLLGATSTNLLKNPEFNGIGNWDYRIYTDAYVGINTSRTYDYSTADQWYYINGYKENSMAVKPNNNGSIDVWLNRTMDNGPAGSVVQTVTTIPGHRYEFKYTTTNMSNGLYNVMIFKGTSLATESPLASSGAGWSSTFGAYTLSFTAQTTQTTVDLNAFRTANSGTVRFSNLSLVDIDAVGITINPLNTKSTTATGTATPNASVDIYAGSTKLGTGTANSSGVYNISIPAQTSGTIVKATDNATGLSATTTVTQAPLQPTTITDVYTTSTVVSGTAEPNSNVVVKNSAGTTIASGKASATGAYNFTITPQKYNDTLTATATIGTQSSAASTKVKDNTTPSRPIVNPVTDLDTTISGKGVPGNKIEFTLGGTTYSGTVDANGNYTITIPKQAAGTIIDVYQVNPNNGNKSPAATVTVQDTTLAKPVISPVEAGDTTVTVTGAPGATITLTTPDGQSGSKLADATGKAVFTVDPAKINDVYTATQTGANGKPSPAATYTVVDTSTPAAPTPNTVKDTDTSITGKAVPGNTVTVKIDGVSYTGTTDASGNFYILIPKQPSGKVIEVTQTSQTNGNVSPVATVTVQDTTLAKPVISPVEAGDTKVTVTGVPGASITLTTPDGQSSSKLADATGKAIFTVDPAKIDDVYSATQTGANGKPSPAATYTVVDTSTPDAPTPNTVKDTDTSITGKAVPGNTVTVKIDGATYTGTADASGNFNISIPKQPSGKVIEVTQTSKTNGNVSPVATVTVQDTTLAKPVISPVEAGDTKVTVTGVPGATITLTTPDGQKTAKIADATGKATFNVDPAKAGDMYTATQTGANGKPSPAATAVATAVATSGTITTTDFTLGKDKNIIGTYTGDVKSFRVTINGNVYKGGTINPATGTYSFYAYDKISELGTFKIEGLDASGKVLDTKIGSIVANNTPNPPGTGTITTTDFTLGKDKNIIGTYTGDVKSFRVTINGNVYTGGAINPATGTYSFYAYDKISELGTFKIEGLDASGKVLDTKTGSIVANNTPNPPGTGTITTNTFTIHQDKSVTGTFTGDVVSLGLVYDGMEYKGGTLNSDGSYSFYALNTITDKTKPAIMNGYDRYGNKIATSAVSLLDANDSQVGTGTVNANPFVIGIDKSITGTFTGDVKSLSVSVGGVEYRGGTLNADGTFIFYAWDKVKNTTDSVVVNGFDRNGNKIATSAVSVTKPNTSGTITPNTFTVPTDKFLTASYTGDVKTVKVNINGVDYAGGTVTNGQVNFYIGDKIKSANDIVRITAFDAYGQILDQKAVNVTSASSTTTGTVTPDLFTAGKDTFLTGSYTGDVKSVKVSINGNIYTGGTVADGSINFYIGNKITSSGDIVKIYGYDAYGKQLDVKDVDIKNIYGDIQPDAYTVPGDTFLTANVSSAVNSVKVTINGTVYIGGTIADGRLSFWIGDKIKSASDVVSIAAFDKNGRELDSKSVQLLAAQPAVGTITPATFSLSTSSLTGTYTGEGKTIRVIVNGTALPAGGTLSSGNFSYYVGMKNKISSTTDVVKIQLIDKNGLLMDEKPVTILN